MANEFCIFFFSNSRNIPILFLLIFRLFENLTYSYYKKNWKSYIIERAYRISGLYINIRIKKNIIIRFFLIIIKKIKWTDCGDLVCSARENSTIILTLALRRKKKKLEFLSRVYNYVYYYNFSICIHVKNAVKSRYFIIYIL